MTTGQPRHRAAKPGKAQKPDRVRRERAPRKHGLLLRACALALALAVAVAAGIVAFLVHRSSDRTSDLKAAGRSAVAAANADVEDILSYDYRQLQSDISSVKGELTGQLLSDYTASAQKVLASAPSIKAIVKATLSASSVVHATPDRVTVLAFVDQESVKQLKGAKTPTTRIDPIRVQLVMSKVNGRWLASDLQPL
jgi:Mce-associated membrane protein